MKSSFVLVLGTILLAGTACDNEPAKGKAHASVSEAVSAAPQAATAPANGASYAFSQAGSTVQFVGAKVTNKHEGKINTFNGVIQLVENEPTKSSVSVDLDIASLTADDEKLTKHLMSPDFFDAAKFPKATFKSTSIKAGGDNGASHTITGNLELHGVTKQISFPARIKATPENVKVEAEFVINRKDFGIVYPGMANDLIKDDVLISLKLDGKKS